MGEFGIGQSVRRKEDDRLIVGKGNYVDDIVLPNMARGTVVRSPHANAKILSIDTGAAKAMPGVLAVYTHADIAHLGALPCVVDGMFKFTRRDGSPRYFPVHHALVKSHVRHVGDGIAFVVAETLAQARTAAEAVMIDYDILPAVTDTLESQKADVKIYDDAPDNTAFVYQGGNKDKTDAAFAGAAHVVRFRHYNNRLVANSMEPRGAIGTYDTATRRYTIHLNTQSVFRNRTLFAKLMGVEESRMRLIAPDIGGSFGMKGFSYPEQLLVMFAAERLGRPVKWYSDRSEAFVSDVQGRDIVMDAELALDRNGKFLAVRAKCVGSLGAYASNFAPMIISVGSTKLLPGVYDIPTMHAEVEVVFSNKVMTDAYRGAGRPEAAYVIERLVDTAARKLKIDPAELRRRNFIKPSQLPYMTAGDYSIDSGDFARNMEDGLKLSDWAGVQARKKESAVRGKLRGIGMAVYMEATAGGASENSRIEIAADGSAKVYLGALAQGQGHATTFSQIVAEKLGIAFDKIDVIEGDSDHLAKGGGTGGSRSGYSAGGAIVDGTTRIIEKASRIAAHMLEAADSDIEFAAGRFTIAGTDRSMSFADVAKAATDPANMPPGIAAGLTEESEFTSKATFPNGCHVVEVEVDPDTGAVQIERYSIVDDFGVMLNPMIVEGQVHGGVAQGVGQALYEDTIYDRETGQLLTGSFMDYCMPKADHFPSFAMETNVVPCKTNPLGMKGAGESGTTGATGAVMNAVIDALSPLGIDHLEMPASPERVWRAIQDARATKAA